MPHGGAWLAIAALIIGAAAIARDGANAAPYRWQLPRGFPTPAVPADNPMSEAKVTLGGRRFTISRDGVMREITDG